MLAAPWFVATIIYSNSHFTYTPLHNSTTIRMHQEESFYCYNNDPARFCRKNSCTEIHINATSNLLFSLNNYNFYCLIIYPKKCLLNIRHGHLAKTSSATFLTVFRAWLLEGEILSLVFELLKVNTHHTFVSTVVKQLHLYSFSFERKSCNDLTFRRIVRFKHIGISWTKNRQMSSKT